ncbi:MAG: ATP-binding protein [Clostridia bacterium]
MIDELIAETTGCDFKVALEIRKPKSWLKSISAFANGIGGMLLFGVNDDKEIVGLLDVQDTAEKVSELIKALISPLPPFVISAKRENGKDILTVSINSGRSTPYYYCFDGVREAYIRVGNESVIAPDYIVNELILKGSNRSYDSLRTEYAFSDFSFSNYGNDIESGREKALQRRLLSLSESKTQTER